MSHFSSSAPFASSADAADAIRRMIASAFPGASIAAFASGSDFLISSPDVDVADVRAAIDSACPCDYIPGVVFVHGRAMISPFHSVVISS